MATATATKKDSTRRGLYIWTAAAVVVLLVFYGVHLLTRTTLPVRTARAERSSLRSTIASNGKVEPQVNFEAHAPFPGLIRQVYVREGDKASAGKLLVQMDDTDARARLATALSGLRGAQASYDALTRGGTREERLSLGGEIASGQIARDQAQREVAALEKLVAKGEAAPSELSAARDRLANATASLQVLNQRQSSRYDAGDVAHVKAALENAQAAYAAAQQVLEQANVRAPFAGTVYSLPVSATEYVQQGDRLLQMADLTKLQVRAYIDEPEIGKLALNQPITIRWDAHPDRLWHGHIVRVPSTIITYGTRNVGEVLVAIEDPDGTLLPSTNVTVTVTTADIADALTVPREALHSERGQSYVYRVEADRLRRTPVTVGTTNLTQVQILSGLKQGDVVALGSTNGVPMRDGVPANVVQ